jgi:FAD/FMN-containing dehydrogenase
MTATNLIAESGLAAARDLRAAMRCKNKVVLPGDIIYDDARRIWNGAVDHHPALIVRCETSQDVQMAVRTAREHNLPLSVRGGGHDWAGRSMRHQGLVIDLSLMRRVKIYPEARVASIAGGATATDVVAAAAPHGLVAVTSNCGGVGMVGLTLGGGYGPLSARFGLALDNLVSVEIILADGRLVVANAVENAELFWALRGGGGNFGVVTSMRVRLHPIRTLLGGLILFPWCEAEAVVRRYAEAVMSAPDELVVQAGVLSRPDGAPVLFLAPIWSGEPGRGERVMAGLQRLGAPMLAQIGPMAYGDMLRMFDAQIVNGRHYALKTRWFSELAPRTITALIAAGGRRTSPFTAIVIHQLHGAATRIPLETTAFGLRREHFMVELIAAWEPNANDDGHEHRQWAESLSELLASTALPGGYPNLLAADDHEQIAFAYGNNLARLKKAKQRFDPDGVFSATPMPT